MLWFRPTSNDEDDEDDDDDNDDNLSRGINTPFTSHKRSRITADQANSSD